MKTFINQNNQIMNIANGYTMPLNLHVVAFAHPSYLLTYISPTEILNV